jgi:hypothetical protein
MLTKFRLPSPAMVVALVALFVALGGTAVAAGPIVKRALLADNALKLQGKPLAAVVQQAAAEGAKLPGPASSAAGLVSVKAAPWSAAPGQSGEFTVACDSGQKAVSGGFEDPNGWAHPWDTRPTPDGGGWRIYVGIGRDAPGAQSGTIYAVCLK